MEFLTSSNKILISIKIIILFYAINIYAKDIEVISKYCKINWTQNYIECKGISAEGQSRYSAIRSAEIIAKSHILEFVQGIKITSEINVKSALAANSTIIESLNGAIMGARVMKSEYLKSSGYGEAYVRLNIGSDILESILNDPSIKIVSEDNFSFFSTNLYADTYYSNQELMTIRKIYKDLVDRDKNRLPLLSYVKTIINKIEDTKTTGIIIDATGIENFEIAAIPRIRDEEGNELYPKNIVSKETIFRKNGVVCYEAILNDAQKNKRVASSPLVIKAKSIYGHKTSDLVIDLKNKKILLLNKKLLRNAKVLILLSL
ncbi:hypothetical protein [Sulfurimonas sp.]